MAISRWALGLFAAMAGALLSGGGSLRGQDLYVDWDVNYQEALARAKKTGMPIFLEFRCET